MRNTKLIPTFLNRFPFCSVNVLNYNEKEYLNNCLASLSKINYPRKRYEIILIDNGSSDGSVDFVKETFPKIKIIQNRNIGFSAGNNIALRNEESDYCILLNADAAVDKNWLVELVKVAESDKSIGLCTSKIMMLDDNKIINSAGGVVHFLGFAWPRGLYTRDKNQFDKNEETTLASGASLLIRKNIFRKVGYFDEIYFLYCEDLDYTWRARLAGFKAIFVPNSVVYHKYGGSVRKNITNFKKFYFVERNRLVTIMKNYSLETLLVILPIMLLTEIGFMLYYSSLGSPLLKIRTYYWILKNIKGILIKRKEIQITREVTDGEVVGLFVSKFSYFPTSVIFKILNSIMPSYWNIAQNLI